DLKKTVNVFPVGHCSPLLAFAPDGRSVATKAAPGTVKILDVATGKEIGSFDQHDGGVNALAFSPSGSVLAVGCGTTGTKDMPKTPGYVRLWDVKLGKVVSELKF